MTTQPTDMCERVQEHLTLYIDNRIEPDAREAVAAHVETCPDCRDELTAMRRLSAAGSALAPEPVSPDLADRVRETVATRARMSRGFGARIPFARAAAALIVLSGFGAAYLIGRFHGEETSGNTVPINEANVAWPSGPDFEPTRFVRGTRALLDDVTVIDRVEPELRRPLLLAQLDHFGLEQQAASWLRRKDRERHPKVHMLNDLAGFVDGLAHSLRRDRLPARDQVRQARILLDTLADDIPAALHEAPPLHSPEHLDEVMKSVAAELREAQRTSLHTVLTIKQSWIDGRFDLPVRFAQEMEARRRMGRELPDALRVPVHRTVGFALMEAGLGELAFPFFDGPHELHFHHESEMFRKMEEMMERFQKAPSYDFNFDNGQFKIIIRSSRSGSMRRREKE